MNIVNKSPNMVEFIKLSCGSVFKDQNSNYCMKLEYYSDVNMVYLTDGTLGFIEDSERVEKVRCELVVEN